MIFLLRLKQGINKLALLRPISSACWYLTSVKHKYSIQRVASVTELSVVEPKCKFAAMTSAAKQPAYSERSRGVSLEEVTSELRPE